MGLTVSLLSRFWCLKADSEKRESSRESGSCCFSTKANAIIAKHGRPGDRYPTALVSHNQPTGSPNTNGFVSEGKVDADGDQIMGSAVHNSQFTQSLLLFVSATVELFKGLRTTRLIPSVPNTIWDQVYPMPNKVLLFTGGRNHDETHSRELVELQCQMQGIGSCVPQY